MNDRELLEQAARAAGYWDKDFDYYKSPISWDPIEKDEDALRLAVQLRLGLVYGPKADAGCWGFPAERTRRSE